MANEVQLPKPSDLPAWDRYDELRESNFEAMVEQRESAKAKKEAGEAEEKRLNSEIEGLLILAGVEKGVAIGDLAVMRCNGSSPSKLDTKLLLEKGVSADLIAQCTVPGKSYTYIQILERKVKK